MFVANDSSSFAHSVGVECLRRSRLRFDSKSPAHFAPTELASLATFDSYKHFIPTGFCVSFSGGQDFTLASQ
jgi:hypothetical protein